MATVRGMGKMETGMGVIGRGEGGRGGDGEAGGGERARETKVGWLILFNDTWSQQGYSVSC